MPSFSSFKQKIFKFNFVDSEKIYNVHNPNGPNLLTRQRLGLIHLRALTFSHNCSYCLNELCIYCTNIKPTNHFLLQCPLYISEGKALMEKIRGVEISILDRNENCLFYTLLFGSVKLNDIKDTHREKVPSNKSLSVKTKTNPNFAVKPAERSNHSFLLYI